MFDFSERTMSLCKEADKALLDVYARIDEIALINTDKVMKAFKNNRVSESHFAASTGYGYDDVGRTVTERIFAEVFGKEDALVRHSIVNGTQALTIGLFGLLRPGDTLLSVTGKPYDTMEEVNLKALELIQQDEYDLLVVYNVSYDGTMHKTGPEAPAAMEALKDNIWTYRRLVEAVEEHWKGHDVVYGFMPDHGCHQIDKSAGSHGLDMEEDMNIIHFYGAKPRT